MNQLIETVNGFGIVGLIAMLAIQIILLIAAAKTRKDVLFFLGVAVSVLSAITALNMEVGSFEFSSAILVFCFTLLYASAALITLVLWGNNRSKHPTFWLCVRLGMVVAVVAAYVLSLL